MATVILLTGAQATQVSGPSNEQPKIARLNPIALTDGRYILGVEVLTDPLHAEDAVFLATLPQTDFSNVSNLIPQPT